MIEFFKEIFNSQIGHICISILGYCLFMFIIFKMGLKLIDKISQKVEPNGVQWKLLKQVLKLVILTLVIIGVVDIIPGSEKIGIALVACSSVIVAALGLASQDALGNAIDGVFISLFKPFREGDRIRLVSRNITGTVEGINLRYTTIKTVENNVLMIPNSIMNDEIVENSNIEDQKIKTFIDVSVGYDTDIPKMKQVICDVVTSHSLFIDTRSEDDIEKGVSPVGINIRNFGASGVDVRITICSANISDSFILSSDIRENLLKAFKENGIEIPYNIIDLRQN